MNCKCKDCVHCVKINGTYRCQKRQFMITPKLIRAWGCDNYKPNYESLLKGNEK